MSRKLIGTKADAVLGQNIEKLRISKQISRRQLGRKINKVEQQIEKYEQGAFIPLPVIEKIGEALDEPVQKKIIRRISFARKTEEETGDQQEELINLYNEAIPEPEGDD